MKLNELLQNDHCRRILQEAFTARLEWMSQGDSHHDPIVERAAQELIANDMILMEALIQPLRALVEKPELVLQLLSHAYACAKAPGTRRHVRRLAANVGLARSLPEPEEVDLKMLTEGQATAFRELVALTELYFDVGIRQETGPELRIAPLLVAHPAPAKPI